MENIITTKRGIYGRVNITLPIQLKECLFAIQKRSGLKKAEFLRLVVATGLIEIS